MRPLLLITSFFYAMASSSHEQYVGKMSDRNFIPLKGDVKEMLPSDRVVDVPVQGGQGHANFLPKVYISGSSAKWRRVRGKWYNAEISEPFELVEGKKGLKEKKLSGRETVAKKGKKDKGDNTKVSTDDDDNVSNKEDDDVSNKEDDDASNKDDDDVSNKEDDDQISNQGDDEIPSNEIDTEENENNQVSTDAPTGNDTENDDDLENIDIEEDDKIGSDVSKTEQGNQSSNTTTIEFNQGGKETESIVDGFKNETTVNGFKNETKANEDYPIVSCGALPETKIKLELTYIYNFVTSNDEDVNQLVQFVETQALDTLSMEFVHCERRRHLLPSTVSVVGMSASPPDVPSGSCGDECTTVVGGMTVYLMEQPNQENDKTNHDTNFISCQILDRFQSVLLDFELLNTKSDIHNLAFSETQDLGCDAYYDPNNSSFRIQGSQSREDTSKVTSEIVIGVTTCISLFGFLGLIVMRRHHYYRTVRDVPITTTVNDDEKEDRWSTVTPDTAGDSRQSPCASKSSSSSPDREESRQGRASNNNDNDDGGSRKKTTEEISIGSFDPEMLDLSNKSPNHVSNSIVRQRTTSEKAVLTSMVGGSGEFWTQIWSRVFNPNSMTFRSSSHQNKDDFFSDEGCDDHPTENIDSNQAIVVKHSLDMKPSPVMELWLESVSSDSSDGQSDCGSRTKQHQQLHVIPEGDDEDRSEVGISVKLGVCEDDTLSDATAEVSNVSPERRLRRLLEPPPNPRQRTQSPTYLLL